MGTEVVSIEEPPRRLWVCPQGYVGKDQCDASGHNSNCCGYSIPGENCGDRADDCFCYQWNCHGPVNSLEALPKLDNSTEVVSIEEPPRRLWVCPQGFVGKDQCDASGHNSNCCGYSIPGENCGDRAGDCFCYQWNCHGHPPSWEALPKLDNSTGASNRSGDFRRLRR